MWDVNNEVNVSRLKKRVCGVIRNVGLRIVTRCFRLHIEFYLVNVIGGRLDFG